MSIASGMTIKPGVDTNGTPVTPSASAHPVEPTVSSHPPCDHADCPLLTARKAGEQGGPEAEAHVLRVQMVEMIHKLGALRTRLRAMGVDPDTPFHPSDIEDRS
jgi:hypothetical protein